MTGNAVSSVYVDITEKPSVCLSVRTVMPISQPCQHGLKWDLLEMKAESSGTIKYCMFLRDLHMILVIHMSVQKALV